MFESRRDQLEDILNILYDEDIQTTLDYFDYNDIDDMFGQMGDEVKDSDLQEFGFKHGDVSQITIKFSDQREYELVCNVADRVAQLYDVVFETRYNNNVKSPMRFVGEYRFVDTLKGFDVQANRNDTLARIKFLPFFTDRYLDNYEVMCIRHERDTYTLWSEYALTCSMNDDTREISGIIHDDDMHLKIGDNGRYTHEIYKGKKITAIDYQVVEGCIFPNKYTIHMG